ncbi:MAG: hypothetical protein GC179_16190 [Anaerolineaceae bacterium]|nr:hypothetical protein [Anaerolineaceae bacterium]
MHNKKIVFLFIFSAFLMIFPTAIFAQDDLTQTFTSDNGKFSMSYPAGWTVKVNDGLINIGGSVGFLQVSFYDNNNSGYAPVTPLELLEVGIGEDKDSRAMLGFTEPEDIVVGGYPALVSRSESMSQLQVVIDFGDGVIATAIGFGPDGKLGASESVFMAMIESIRYGDTPPPPIVKSPLADIKAITPANAASVSQLMTLGEETATVESIAFSPDGKWLAVGSSDGIVKLWNVATGESGLELKGHTNGATSVAFGSGGYSIAVGTANGEVRLWDATSGESYGFLQKHDTRVESVAFTDGFLVASGALDGSVKLWDIAMGKEQPALAEKDELAPVGSVAFSPDGAKLAVGAGSTIKLWDITAGTAPTVLETEISKIATLSFSPDGTSLVYGGAGTAAWVWDLKGDNHALLEGHTDQVMALAFSPDGQVIASGDAGALRLWAATKGENLAALTSPSGQAVNSVAFNPDGTLIASAGSTGGVVLWGTADNASSGTGAASAGTNETSEAATTEQNTASASGCTITAPNKANLRSGPGTEFNRAGALSGGQTAHVDGQAKGSDGMVWYRLTDGAWVRSDVIGSPTECTSVPVVTP